MLNDAKEKEEENEFPEYDMQMSNENKQESEVQVAENPKLIPRDVLEENHHPEEAGADQERKNTEKPTNISNLITLKYISVCQCCKENFNGNDNLPYLLKCGHFFCKSCILNNFINNKNQIVCPDDGSSVSSLKDLKVLNNLISEEKEKRASTKDNKRDSNNNIMSSKESIEEIPVTVNYLYNRLN